MPDAARAVDPRIEAALAGEPLAPLPDGFVARAVARATAVDPRIDAALATAPLAPLPDGFVARAIGRIVADAAGGAEVGRRVDASVDARVARAVDGAPPQATRASRARAAGTRLRRLPVLDVLVPAFLVVLFVATLGVVVWSLNAIDPLWGARLVLHARLTWESARLAAPDLGAGFVVAVGAAFTLVACLAGLALSVEPMLAGGVGRVRGRGMG